MPDQFGKPLTPQEVRDRIRPRPALSQKLLATQQRLHVVGSKEPPRVQTKVVAVENTQPGAFTQYEVIIEIDGVRVGERSAPSPINGKGFRQGLPRLEVADRDKLLSAFLPEHLALSTAPTRLQAARQVIFTNDDPKIKRPTTVFTPDQRRIFQDTSYPWGTVGLVQTPHGTGSGVMIGP